MLHDLYFINDLQSVNFLPSERRKKNWVKKLEKRYLIRYSSELSSQKTPLKLQIGIDNQISRILSTEIKIFASKPANHSL